MQGKVDSWWGAAAAAGTEDDALDPSDATFVLAALAELAMADQITGSKAPGYPGQLAIQIAWRVVVALVGVGGGGSAKRRVERCVCEMGRGEIKCIISYETGDRHVGVYVGGPAMVIEDERARRVERTDETQ